MDIETLKNITFLIFLISYIVSQYSLLRWMRKMNNYQAVQDRALLFLLSVKERTRGDGER